jgi:hypothetical protein
VDVAVADAGGRWALTISNPTDFDADVKLLIDRRADFAAPLEQCVGDACRAVPVKARGPIVIHVEK